MSSKNKLYSPEARKLKKLKDFASKKEQEKYHHWIEKLNKMPEEISEKEVKNREGIQTSDIFLHIAKELLDRL